MATINTIILGVCENPKIPDGRDESGKVGSCRIPENFEIPKGIGFAEKVEIPENFENPAEAQTYISKSV